jgi:hypothetical protein
METLKAKNRVTSTFLTKLLKNESLLWSLLFRIKFINYSFKELRSFFLLYAYIYKRILKFGVLPYFQKPEISYTN